LKINALHFQILGDLVYVTGEGGRKEIETYDILLEVLKSSVELFS
jgi:hypothetical protein